MANRLFPKRRQLEKRLARMKISIVNRCKFKPKECLRRSTILMVVFFQINIFFIKERYTIRLIIRFCRFHICSGNTILFARDCIQDLIYLGGNLPLKLYSKPRLVRANKTLKESVQTRLKS